MNHHASAAGSQQPWSALRRFTRSRQAPAERCELCSEPLPTEHPHLVEPPTRRILCACEPCALLFDSNQTKTRYQRIPRDVLALPGFTLTDPQWASLNIPIGLAFVFHSSPAEGMIAIYPSPAGPTEAHLAPEAWQSITQNTPALRNMRPDIEALLINRLGRTHHHYLTPIDRCYELVGLIRTHWQGLSGGTEVWQRVERFFTRLNENARQPREQRHA